MRPTLLLSLLLLVATLTGCTGTRPYSQEDLHQVRQAAATVVPIYVDFMQAYDQNDRAELQKDMRLHRKPCGIEDQVDRRDTIDPNVNLFEASADVDNICNGMEGAYARWAIAHHLPYDKSVTPAGTDPFNGSQITLAKLPVLLAHPGDKS